MRLSKPYPPRLRFRIFNRFTMATCLLLLTATVTIAEAPIQPDTSLITDLEKPTQEWAARELIEIQQKSVTVSDVPALTDTSLITDSENPIPKSLARELLDIQQDLGGSIVSDRQLLQDIPPFSTVDHAEVTDFPAAVVQFNSDFSASRATAKLANSTSETVQSLRDAAWKLDQSAEKLERTELYKQADALRNLAQQFRLDARAIRALPGE